MHRATFSKRLRNSAADLRHILGLVYLCLSPTSVRFHSVSSGITGPAHISAAAVPLQGQTSALSCHPLHAPGCLCQQQGRRYLQICMLIATTNTFKLPHAEPHPYCLLKVAWEVVRCDYSSGKPGATHTLLLLVQGLIHNCCLRTTLKTFEGLFLGLRLTLAFREVSLQGETHSSLGSLAEVATDYNTFNTMLRLQYSCRLAAPCLKQLLAPAILQTSHQTNTCSPKHAKTLMLRKVLSVNIISLHSCLSRATITCVYRQEIAA